MKKRILAISAVLGIFAIVLSAGTLAYFTDLTDPVVNTFTVGNVDIELDEEEKDNWAVDAEGHAKMKLMPREETYAKTPKVTVEEGSEDAYVFANIELSNAGDYVHAVANLLANENKTSDQWVAEYEAGQFDSALQGGLRMLLTQENGFIQGFNRDEWEIIAFNIDKTNDVANIIIAHKDVMTAGDATVIFTGINVPTEMPSELFDKTKFVDATITITAAAIQADGFSSYEDAGAALACQWNMGTALGITCE